MVDFNNRMKEISILKEDETIPTGVEEKNFYLFVEETFSVLHNSEMTFNIFYLYIYCINLVGNG